MPERRAEYFLASKCGEYSNYAAETTAYDFSYAAITRSIDNRSVPAPRRASGRG